MSNHYPPLDNIEQCMMLGISLLPTSFTNLPEAIEIAGGVDGIDWAERTESIFSRRTPVPMPRITPEAYQLWEASVLQLLCMTRQGMAQNGDVCLPLPPALVLPFELATA